MTLRKKGAARTTSRVTQNNKRKQSTFPQPGSFKRGKCRIPEGATENMNVKFGLDRGGGDAGRWRKAKGGGDL